MKIREFLTMARHQGKNTIFALWFAYGTPSGTKLKKIILLPGFWYGTPSGNNFFFFSYIGEITPFNLVVICLVFYLHTV